MAVALGKRDRAAVDRQDLDGLLETARSALAPPEFERAWARGVTGQIGQLLRSAVTERFKIPEALFELQS